MNLIAGELYINEFINNPKFEPYIDKHNEKPLDVFYSSAVDIENNSFDVEVMFVGKRIDTIILNPVNIKDKVIKQKICNDLLKKHLGKPYSENDSILYYEYEWGTIVSASMPCRLKEYSNGFIEIVYNPLYKGA